MLAAIQINLFAGWIAILAGLLSGAGIGLFFHDPAWLGGYGSWTRRMVRLGHIAMVATGLLNIAFAVTALAMKDDRPWRLSPVAFMVGAVAMPTICFASAFWKPARHLFFIPVLALVLGAAEVVYRGVCQ